VAAIPGTAAALPWTALALDEVPSLTYPTSTRSLSQGAQPKRPWLVGPDLEPRARSVLHVNGSEYDVGSLDFVKLAPDGYITARGGVGGSAPYVLHRPGRPDEVLARFTGEETVSTGVWMSPTGQLVWSTEDLDGDHFFVRATDGCTEELSFTEALKVANPQMWNGCSGEVTGFYAPDEAALAFYCLADDVDMTERSTTVTTAGRAIRYPGLDHDLAIGVGNTGFSARSQVLAGVVFESSKVKARGFDLMTGAPRWAHTFTVAGRDVRNRFFAMSPSGRRVLAGAVGGAVVLDARTGEPVVRLVLPETVDQVWFEDDRHLLLGDNGIVDVYGSRDDPHTDPQSSWLVRCSLESASCERATAVPPADPVTATRVVE
jgi:hypothetical protein